MQRWGTLPSLFTAACLVLLLAGCPDGNLTVVDDHGDSPPVATNIEPNGGPVSGTLTSEDVDYFRCEVALGTEYVFEVRANAYVFVSLFDEDGGTLLDSTCGYKKAATEAAQDAATGKPGVSAGVQAGEYATQKTALTFQVEEQGVLFVSVRPRDAISGICQYTLLVSEVGASDDDHSDTAKGATPVEVDGQPVAGVLTAFDIDYYCFDAQEGVDYVIETTGNTDTVLYLFAQSSEYSSSSSDDDSGEGNNARIAYTASKTYTYYFAVVGYDQQIDVGPYQVQVRSALVPGDDHGDDAANATPVEVDGASAGGIITAADTDYFSFPVQKLQPLAIQVEAGFDASFTVYHIDGITGIDSVVITTPGSTKTMTIEPTVDGTYFVAARSRYGSSEGSYTITVLTEDHADSEDSATSLIVNGGAVTGVLLQGDEDWFRFEGVEDTTYVIETQGTTDTCLDVGYLKSKYDDDSGEGRNARLVFTPSFDSAIYVAVTGYDPLFSVGAYTISVTTQ